MKTVTFKTNLNCGNCVARVTPFLNKVAGVSAWQVDTDNPAKILTVSGEDFSEEDIIAAVKRVGFTIENA